MKWLAYVVVLSGCLTSLVRAQGKEGQIVDLAGNPVVGVEVEVKSRCFPTASPMITQSTSVTSDAGGRFIWPEIALGVGSNCVRTLFHTYTLKKDGFVFTRKNFIYKTPDGFLPLPPYDDRLPIVQATSLPGWVSVSAASFDATMVPFTDYQPGPFLASGMLLAGFGTGLAELTVEASLPLPTELAGRKVLIKDANGAEKTALLLYVSPAQINYVVPEGLAEGPAQIRLVDRNGNLIRIGLAQVRRLSPGIFTANFNGSGVPAGLVVRVKPGNV